ncbi:MAG: PilZ domain-containing protein [Candidatus Omnitrophica bacterium]|nr:PilZ domain-containing protein [Candidatus Omnitrophota bacterium]
MKKTSAAEKRQYPRIDHKLPIQVVANGYDFATSTQNVSCVGAYCSIKKYMPPFTRVMIKLTLPVKTDTKDIKYNVECKGVVVRTDDENKGSFNIAVFFNEIKDDQRKKISRYINQFLPEKSAPTKRI